MTAFYCGKMKTSTLKSTQVIFLETDGVGTITQWLGVWRIIK